MVMKIKEEANALDEERADRQRRAVRSDSTTEMPPVEDQQWEIYVSHLAPDDEQGAFLLPDELPNQASSPQEIRAAIRTASRRAFGRRSAIRVENYV